MREVVERWFRSWEEGNYREIPVSDGFRHTSPFGTTVGKTNYLEIVEANASQFLGFHFEIHEAIYEEGRACVRYTARKGEFSLDVSEWFYGDGEQIDEILSYYHLGEEADYSNEPGAD